MEIDLKIKVQVFWHPIRIYIFYAFLHKKRTFIRKHFIGVKREARDFIHNTPKTYPQP